MKSIILGMLNTTVQPTLNLKEIKSLPIPIPDDISIAQAIGEFSELFTERIYILRQTNATFESIAQALFKSWFVDFDPVRAKAEGREPEGMDIATAALFPAEFEESAVGQIPKGWRVCALSDLCESIFSGGTPDTRRTEYWNGTLPWFSSGETRESVVIDTEKHITEAAVENSSTRLARPGDILIASAGQGLTRGQTSYCAIETYINQSVVSVRTSREVSSPTWTFYNLARRYDELRGLSDSHSIRGSLTTKLLASLRIIAPPTSLMMCFGATTEALVSAQAENRRRAGTLAELRDALLPRLVSGKLRIPQAQAQLEEAIA
ncbi:restriction endonuclease subunit S [Ramlibacter montanisoli]|uniref:Restriction endonuclease subunit S n=1 Tax=Ramlibacter montanisoli TaxID=2732512 RepID=A0A849K7T5_9BURK|nr:restriction endonuclease subunit S [Ramlibacter montanisoli]NNU43570.1 restriction endonuclease subunit S [Ramlibacter montanisoli]